MTEPRKLLIAVVSCQRDRKYHSAIRDTWGEALRDIADVYFFVGGDYPHEAYEPDEVWFNCEDDYSSLSTKVTRVFEWALSMGYRHTFKCDVDSWVDVKSFRAYNYTQHDYAGKFVGNNYASGGGYFLSELAMRCVLRNADLSITAEDAMVGTALRPFDMRVGHLGGHDIYQAQSGHRGRDHKPTKFVLIEDHDGQRRFVTEECALDNIRAGVSKLIG